MSLGWQREKARIARHSRPCERRIMDEALMACIRRRMHCVGMACNAKGVDRGGAILQILLARRR